MTAPYADRIFADYCLVLPSTIARYQTTWKIGEITTRLRPLGLTHKEIAGFVGRSRERVRQCEKYFKGSEQSPANLWLKQGGQIAHVASRLQK